MWRRTRKRASLTIITIKKNFKSMMHTCILLYILYIGVNFPSWENSLFFFAGLVQKSSGQMSTATEATAATATPSAAAQSKRQIAESSQKDSTESERSVGWEQSAAGKKSLNSHDADGWSRCRGYSSHNATVSFFVEQKIISFILSKRYQKKEREREKKRLI